jgi:transketolase N-terminal domain/subunit
MPIVNAFSTAAVREFSLEELEHAARLMRRYDLMALCAAGSGHTGGTLSMMEIVAALYLKVANHDPNLPEWADRDRIVSASRWRTMATTSAPCAWGWIFRARLRSATSIPTSLSARIGG